ncbi:DNA topoisomerase I [Candidatus Micrarchaeota archaeon]|nr:DNA topoisomerase I [Candidatus Micrarchaeota archaeon]MBU1887105.1 DNA topoisomerase I [Candidatus Micrarchaeota archaeon]
MELIVAEKPSVAEKIANAIGDNVKKQHHNGVAYYEATCDGNEVVIAPAVGHIYTLVEREKSRSYPAFDIEWVPAYQVSKAAEYTKGYVETLQKLGKKADMFVSACDYDLEGSTIAYNIFRYATTIREGQRMKFSALTKTDLVEAYHNRGDFDYNNAYAGETRHVVDWYYGINLSRALMSALNRAHKYRVLSIGRVQGPALSILSDLELKIKAFVPTPYWEVSTNIKNTEFMHSKGRFLKEGDAKKAIDNTSDSGEITKIERKEQEIQPGPCFDLTSLQVEAYKLFKFIPSKTLQLSQSLYEATMITYPRTSSQKIPSTIKITPIVSALASMEEYKSLAEKLIENKWLKPIQGKKDDPAHPAIHPTGVGGNPRADEKKLYDLIVRRFLSSCAQPAMREQNRVEVDSNGESYSVSGSRIIEKGWTEFYGKYYTTEDKELPKFEKGEEVDIKDKQNIKKETKPPKRYTQASIVSELEKRHLGTKATRSVIIETLFKRGYVDGKSIDVTDFGLKVKDILIKYAPEILDENLTKKMEDDIELVQGGKIEKDQVIKESKEILTQILDKWKSNEVKIGKELADALMVTIQQENILGPCDKCDNQLRMIKMKAGRQFIGCTGYPKCTNTYPLPTGALVKKVEKPCSQCNKPMVSVIKGKRKYYTMCIDPNCPSKASWKKSDPNAKNS